MFHPEGPTFWELARQALSSTEQGYDLLAPKFERTPFRTPDELLHAVEPYIKRAGTIASALDVCCGTGAAMRVLRPLCQRRVVGIDFSHNMLDVARVRTADAPGDAQLEFVEGDVLEMEFDEPFDLAVCFGALGHIIPSDQERFVDRVASSLRPGGRFLFASAYMPPFWSRRYLVSRGFNAAMHVRNFLFQPPFIMFYLTFLVPEAKRLLEQRGFMVEVIDGVFAPTFESATLVIGTLEG